MPVKVNFSLRDIRSNFGDKSMEIDLEQISIMGENIQSSDW